MHKFSLAALTVLFLAVPKISYAANNPIAQENQENTNNQSVALDTNDSQVETEKIRTNLPDALVMRSPSRIFEGNKYFLEVSGNSEESLRVEIYRCKEGGKDCLLGSLTAAKKTTEIKKQIEAYKETAKQVILNNQTQGFLLEVSDSQLKSSSKLLSKSILWEQDNQLYILTVSDEEASKIIEYASLIVEGEVIKGEKETPKNYSIEPEREKKPVYFSSTEAKDLEPEKKPSPLQLPPTRLVNLETANQLPQGTFQLTAGTHQASPGSSSSPTGTGYQTYYARIDWGATDKLQLGFAIDFFDDPITREINGKFPELTEASFAPNFKYQLHKDEKLAIGVTGSLELFRLSTSPGLFNSGREKTADLYTIGSLQVPFSYKFNPKIQLHLTPGVAVFPDKVRGTDFFGSFFNIGTGISWQPSDRLSLFANANFPVGSGGNTFNSKDSSISKKVLWTLGGQYAFNPRAAVEGYITNSFGGAPTTSLLAFIPDGDDVLVGANVKYLFDFGQNYASSFRKKKLLPLSNRDKSLLLDGLTLSSANTLPPDTILLRGGLDSNGGSRLHFSYGLANDLQLELPGEQFGGGDTLSLTETAGPGVKFGPGAKLRFLDQSQGDPFSLSVKLLGTRDFGKRPRLGTLFAEIPVTYQTNSQTAFFFNPKGAFNGQITRVGFGLGVNYAVSNNLQLIGEFTPVFTGQRSVWSTGVRYFEAKSNLGLDVYASNAIGQTALGGLVGESATNIGFNVNWMFHP
jgi:hypothetical protein